MLKQRNKGELMDERNRIVENDKPKSRRLYRRKGWKGFVHSYEAYTTNGNFEKVKFDDTINEDKIVEKDDFKTIYKF